MQRPLQPIVIQPRRSRELLRVLASLQILTLILLLASSLDAAPMALLAILWLIHALYTHWRINALAGGRILRLRLDQAGEAQLQFADGRRLRSRLRDDSLITPWWMLLRFEGDGFWRHPSLLLGRDSLDPQEARRLRLLLRFGQRVRCSGPRR